MLETDGFLAPNPDALNLTYGFGLMEEDLKLARGFTQFDIDRSRNPHIRGDFRATPFKSDQFKLVLFDPPHLTDFGTTENKEKHGTHPLVQRYSGFKDTADMRKSLYLAFREIERILAPEGRCILKWGEYIMPLERVLSYVPLGLKIEKRTLVSRRQNRTRQQGTYFVDLISRKMRSPE